MNKKPISRSALIAAVALLSCGILACKKESRENHKSAKVDGQKLFSEIMFIEGEASQKIPELKQVRELSGIDKFNKDQASSYAQYKEFVIADIKEQSPEFFEEFGAQIQSGDPVLVQTALKYAGERILSSTNTLLPLLVIKRNPKLIDSVYSKEDQAKLKELAQITDLSKLKDILKPNPEDGLARGLLRNNAVNLQINRNRFVNLQINRNLDLAVNRIKNFNVNRNFDLDFNSNLNINLQNQNNLQINRARLVDASFNKSNDLNFARNADLGAGSWFNKNENVNENKNVNVNENVNVYEQVNVAVAVNIVLFVIDNTPKPGDFFGREVLFQENLVKSLTKQYAIK